MSGWRSLLLIRQELGVTKHEAELVATLRELDDYEWLEWPRDYDRGETGACSTASWHILGTRIVVCVSKLINKPGGGHHFFYR
jgi:hypothetical protein